MRPSRGKSRAVGEALAGNRVLGRLTVQPAQVQRIALDIERAAHSTAGDGEVGEHCSDAR